MLNTNPVFQCLGNDKTCQTGHVFHNLNNQLENSHLQNINIDDARKLFFLHVDEVIFRNREIRKLQWLLNNYKLVGDYGLDVGDVKSVYL